MSLPSIDVPLLETSRLKMRGHRPEDLAESAAMWGDPIVTRHIGGRPFTPEEVWSRLLRYVGHWACVGFGCWVVEDRATGAFVGEVGFADYKRDLVPSLDGTPELGWVLAPRAHGKGYATEAALAAIAWGETRFAAKRTVCLINEGNAASIRVADKLGYREYARSTYKGDPTILFERS